MVISQTPLRVSFVGGGSDLVSFAREQGGAVVSTTIDKYVYVVVTERFEPDIRVSYSKTEIVSRVDDLEHELVREALRLTGIRRKIEIVTIADVPTRGTGLGSSSAVTVGALNALFAYQGMLRSAAELAEDAAHIEIEVLGKPIGKQDQYASSFGGLNLFRFGPGEDVVREPVILPAATRAGLERNLLMFYTGIQRSADDVLAGVDATAGNEPVNESLAELRDLALRLHADLSAGDPDLLGKYLHLGWEQKRELGGVTSPEIDGWYERARSAGAIGGKLLGAGGGGFLLFYVPRDRQPAVREALAELREMPIRFDRQGSRIIYVGR